MLEALDTIDWKNIYHSHGTAEEFPHWIRELASADKDVREQAYRYVVDYSLHQGTIYEVTPNVVPFVIELLQADSVPDKDRLLLMLAYYTHSAAPEPIPPRREGYPSYARIDFDTHQGDISRTYEGLRQGLALFIDLLRHPDASIRKETFDLLMAFRSDNDLIVPRLIEALAPETVLPTLWSATYSLHEYIVRNYTLEERHKESWRAALMQLIEQSGDAAVRLHAALALAELTKEVLPLQVVQILVDALMKPELLEEAHPKGWMLNSLMSQACQALCYLPLEHAVPIFVDVLPNIRQPEDAHTVAIALLDLLFVGRFREVSYTGDPRTTETNIYYANLPPGTLDELEDNAYITFRISFDEPQEKVRKRGRLYPKSEPIPAANALTERQREALLLVARTDMVWMLHGNLPELYGLPATRSQLRAFLTRQEDMG